MKFYVVYRITNLVDGKIYVGCHETNDLNDSYMGSGRRIVRAIKKHGKSNFKKEIVKICDSREQMFLEESKIVTEEFIARDDVYNLTPGGYGGWKHVKRTPEEHSRISKLGAIKGSAAIAKLIKEDPTYSSKWKSIGRKAGNLHAERLRTDPEYANRHKENVIKSGGGKAFAKKFAEDPDLMKRYKELGAINGKKSAGKIWINHEGKTKMVLPLDLDAYLNRGWKCGRSCKEKQNEIA